MLNPEYTDLLALSTSKVMLQVPMSRLELSNLLIHDASTTDLVVLSAMVTKRKRDINNIMVVTYPPAELVEEKQEVEESKESKESKDRKAQ